MAKDRKYGTLTVPGIGEDEPIVVFRAQDALAPVVLDEYAALNRSMGNTNHADLAEQAAIDFRDWPGKKKLPDSGPMCSTCRNPSDKGDHTNCPPF